jgi:hypothetical protein
MPPANQHSTGKANGTQVRARRAQRVRSRAAKRFVSELRLTEKIRQASLPDEKYAHRAAKRERDARHRQTPDKKSGAAGHYEKRPQKCGGL